MKYWIKGNRKNPKGVLQALLDTGHQLYENGFLTEDDPAWSDPNEVFYTNADPWGNGMYIGHYNKNNLYVVGMMNDKNNKQLKPVKVSVRPLHLTLDEISVLRTLVMEVKDTLQYDESTGDYTDGGRFLISLSEREYKTLMKINL